MLNLPRPVGFLGLAVLVLGGMIVFLPDGIAAFPAEWDVGFGPAVNEVQQWWISNRRDLGLYLYFFDPLSDVIEWLLRAFESLLLAIPWYVHMVGVGVLFGSRMGVSRGVAAAGGMLYFVVLGLWPLSIQTFALMTVAVAVSVAIGVPIGILAARNDWVNRALRPLLDSMQTLPAFVYLIPVLLFFGVARVPSLIATVIYALPPVIRLTNLGIRQVPPESLEAGTMFGTTSGQLLRKVQLPQAVPSILAGINQTIMMALSIVVIAALIGAGGLGQEVLLALRHQEVGRAVEAGMGIVLMAVMLDRFSHSVIGQGQGPAALSLMWSRRGVRILGVVLVAAALLGWIMGWNDAPSGLQLSYAGPIDWAVDWARDNLYQLGNLPLGTGPFSDFLTTYGTRPMRLYLSEEAWPVIVVFFGLVSWWASGKRLVVGSVIGTVVIGLLGMWTLTLDTLSQTVVAVLMAIVIGLPLGIAASRRDWLERSLRPVLDTLQTIPSFCFLVPVVILFNVGRIPGIIASVLYAIAPVVRLTNLGIRSVEKEVVEASESFGVTKRQKLWKIQFPLAMPTVLAGINQTVMLVLAMVVIAGLVGGAGLGLEAVKGLARNDTGLGFEAGASIVILAMILDRITQGWATKFKPPSSDSA
jgi:glycine betaine/proline transport system permease protein